MNREDWFLDGKKAKIEETEDGIILSSGPTFEEDASHCVLWTKKRYHGNLKVSFDYTPLDTAGEESVSVCILYLLAEGEGSAEYPRDITLWNDKRTVPAMSLYFEHMRLYHISFAAYDRNHEPHSYVRAREYKAGGFQGTDLKPDYLPGTLFAPGSTTHIEAMKQGHFLSFTATDDRQTLHCQWELQDPILQSGRVGIRQMGGRKGKFEHITIEC